MSHLESVLVGDAGERRSVHLHDGVARAQPRALRHRTVLHPRYVHTYTWAKPGHSKVIHNTLINLGSNEAF